MTLCSEDLMRLADHAIDAATLAGRYIAGARPAEIQYKSGGRSLASRVLTEVDRRSQEIILEALSPTLERFELGLLAEERDDDQTRLDKPWSWFVDPLDGTLCFVESVPGYSVSIALVARDGTPLLGVVHDPVQDTLFHAIRGRGIFRDRQPWTPAPPRHGALSLFMDRSFGERADSDALMERLSHVAQSLGYDAPQVHQPGGAVMNACRVLMHAPACYFKFPKPHDGGGSLWDFAATACLFHEAGAVATDIHGGPLDLNRVDSTFMNHRGVLFATDEDLAREIRALHEHVD